MSGLSELDKQLIFMSVWLATTPRQLAPRRRKFNWELDENSECLVTLHIPHAPNAFGYIETTVVGRHKILANAIAEASALANDTIDSLKSSGALA